MTLNAGRAGGSVAGLCTWTLSRQGGGSGGCTPYPGVFDRGPLTLGVSGGGPGAFTNHHGFVSDDVERLEAVLADRQLVDVPLTDNFYAVDLPRANLPARLVAYDSEDRVIAVSAPMGDLFGGEAVPARGKAQLLWRAEGPDGSYAELSVGPSTHGDECQFLKIHVDETHRGVGTRCTWQPWADSPVQIDSGWEPGRFVNGRVRDDVATVRIRFADGETVLVEPQRGYVLYAVPADRLTDARRAVGVDGLDASGRVVGSTSFPRPRGG